MRCPTYTYILYTKDVTTVTQTQETTRARTTIRKVNEALPEGIELVKGNGYFYFASEIGVEVDEAFEPAGFWDGSSVYTFHLQNGTSRSG